QFVGLNDNLWRKYINRDFHHLSNIRRRPNETWCDFYNRLSKEETKRLDRIISQSAPRRTTLTTEVITPRQMQRRGGYRQTTCKSSSNNNNALSNFKPRNMSHPSPNGANVHSKINRPIASTSNTNTSNSNAGVSGGGLLNKLPNISVCTKFEFSSLKSQ
ncbi:unnamed protein product, partial [Schistosoma mattheei]